MRLKFALLLGGLVPLAGCHLSKNVARNAYNEPAEIRDEVSVDRQLKKEARAAFAEVKRQYARRAFGDDFQEGFVDGYSDYLDSGGRAEMPAVPPLHYRRARFLNPEGHARIKDYFLGFKYGMDVAIATGCRPFYTFPVLIPEQAEHPPLNITVIPPPPAANAPTPKLGAPLPKADAPMPPAVPPASAPSGTAPSGSAPPATPGLGNPVAPPPGGTGTVPIPSGVVPKPPTPGPGGKSARATGADEGILPVSGILIPVAPDAAPAPGDVAPSAPPPVFDLPDARPFR